MKSEVRKQNTEIRKSRKTNFRDKQRTEDKKKYHLSSVVCHLFSGFTLIELLLVIIIFGMILAVVVPLSVKSLRNLGLTDTARSITSVMKYIQNKAIIEKRIYSLDFDIARSCYSVSVAEDEHLQRFKEIKSSLLSKKNLAGNLKIESLIIKQKDSADKKSSSIYFYPDGSVDETELVLTDSWNEKIIIETALSGRINIRK